jgi:hypothetical protein
VFLPVSQSTIIKRISADLMNFLSINSMVTILGGGGRLKYFFLQKFQNILFSKFFPEILLFVSFLICFFIAEVSHFWGQQIQKHFFF